MNEENVKIARIKKSCRAGKIVSTVICIASVFTLIIGIIGSIKVFSMGKEFDEMFSTGRFAGVISTSDEIGSASAININLGAVPGEIHSDIPAVQAAIDDHPLCMLYGSYILGATIIMAIFTVLIFLIRSVFSIIEKESTPFTTVVKKRVTLVLIITSVVLFLTSGTAPGVLCILLTWAVNAILDYGVTLQVQSDETL